MITGLMRAHAYTKPQAEESLAARGVIYCIIDHLADPGHATGRGARKRPRPADNSHPTKKGSRPERIKPRSASERNERYPGHQPRLRADAPRPRGGQTHTGVAPTPPPPTGGKTGEGGFPFAPPTTG